MKSQLENYLSHQIDNDIVVKRAMNYSLLAEGKRVRPLLLLNLLKDFGTEPELGFPAAAAIEMIHTYSLIHDDLPAMDNDDLRRGKPTCHKAFDEATAILAGDGLLTLAFREAVKGDISAEKKMKIVELLADAAGMDGMIRGQCLDLSYEGKSVSYQQLKEMDHRKTGELLTVPLLCACVISGRDEYMEMFREIGMNIGLAFQIQDDILDVEKSAGELGKSTSDVQNEKSTYVSLLGKEKAKELVQQLFSEAVDKLSNQQIAFTNTLDFIYEISRREK